jgi:hypothetical protein
MRPVFSFLAPLAVLASGCVVPALQDHETNNPEITVQVVATHDGCTIYRFSDGGYHWYVRCGRESSTVALTMKSCGKGCVYNEVVPTKAPQAKRDEER